MILGPSLLGPPWPPAAAEDSGEVLDGWNKAGARCSGDRCLVEEGVCGHHGELSVTSWCGRHADRARVDKDGRGAVGSVSRASGLRRGGSVKMEPGLVGLEQRHDARSAVCPWLGSVEDSMVEHGRCCGRGVAMWSSRKVRWRLARRCSQLSAVVGRRRAWATSRTCGVVTARLWSAATRRGGKEVPAVLGTWEKGEVAAAAAL